MPSKTAELAVEYTTAAIEALPYDGHLLVKVPLSARTWNLAEFTATLPVHTAGEGWLVVIRSAEGDLFIGNVPALGADEANAVLRVRVI